jgi:aconitate decarboxylase
MVAFIHETSEIIADVYRHITGTTGTFGAAAAVGKAMKLPPKQFAAALGHAASIAGGIRAMFGVDTKTLHMGRGAQNGILAAQLAAQDFGSCVRSIESWARLVSTTVNERAISNLPETKQFEILENTFKPYPCGIVIHPLIDAGIEAHKLYQISNSWSPESLERIDAIVNPQCVRLCSVRHPQTGLQTIFSLYHGIASGLLFGQAGPRWFSDEGCKDKALTQIREKIHVSTDQSIKDDEAIVNIKIQGQPERSIHIDHATGSLARPMTAKQLEAKFLGLSGDILGHERATKVIERCWKLDKVQNMAQVTSLLVPA